MAALDVLSSIFTAAWGLFTGVEVPGLGISFAEWFLAIILVGIAVKVVVYVFGFGGSGGSGYRSGQSRNKRISNERKNDEK